VRAVIQRVSRARVVIDSTEHSSIHAGILILLGVEKGDTTEDGAALAKKIVELRIFEDEAGKMNRSILETHGEILASPSSLCLAIVAKADGRHSTGAAPPDEARQLYNAFVESIRLSGIRVETGVFQADMNVELVNQGPVTFILDSKRSC
jgi:D-tyrosyl-tRNA(Tyr) deacylase